MQRTTCVFIAVLALALAGVTAATAQVITRTETITWYDVELEAVRTADNFIVLFNNARTMGRPFKNTGMTHLEAAKAILEERNALMPAGLRYNAGMYTIAARRKLTMQKPLQVHYAMQPYDKAKFGEAIAALPTEAKGATAIQESLVRLKPVLDDLAGRTVVFLFTDGRNTELNVESQSQLAANEFARTPSELAREIAQKYNVCFHVISSAPGDVEAEMARSVGQINQCSRVFNLEDLQGRPEYMAGSLFRMDERIFEVIKKRQKVVGFNVQDVNFDFNSAIVKPEHKDNLNALGKFLQEHPTAYTVMAGFTDDVGSQEFNLQLARRRVEGVRKYLQSQFNIDQDRIVTLWYGTLRPVATNVTEEGRAKNRRVSGIVAGL